MGGGSGLVLGTALAGVVISLAAAWRMSKASLASLNVRGGLPRSKHRTVAHRRLSAASVAHGRYKL